MRFFFLSLSLVRRRRFFLSNSFLAFFRVIIFSDLLHVFFFFLCFAFFQVVKICLSPLLLCLRAVLLGFMSKRTLVSNRFRISCLIELLYRNERRVAKNPRTKGRKEGRRNTEDFELGGFRSDSTCPRSSAGRIYEDNARVEKI